MYGTSKVRRIKAGVKELQAHPSEKQCSVDELYEDIKKSIREDKRKIALENLFHVKTKEDLEKHRCSAYGIIIP